MAKCEVCEKDMFFGRKIRITRSQISRRALTTQQANVHRVKVVVITRSQISRRALTTQQANVHRVKVVVDGTPKSMNVCTRCLRSGKVERA